MKKKIIALCLIVALAATAIIGGTLAYFTDTDEVKNDFVMGSIAIDAYETVKHEDAVGNVKKDEIVDLGRYDNVTTGTTYEDILPGDVMTKVVTVENTGDSAAYVAIAVKNGNYRDNINPWIDDYYEAMSYAEQKAWTGFDTGSGVGNMQAITDSIWTGANWKLNYKKDVHEVRYYPTVTVDQQDGNKNYFNVDETKLIAVDYSVAQGATGDFAVGYMNNMFGTQYDDPNGYTLSKGYYDEIGYGNRIWVYYVYLPAGESYTLDLTVTCPTYITAENRDAFTDFNLDIRATAIQANGFATAKDAFTQLNTQFPFDF